MRRRRFLTALLGAPFVAKLLPAKVDAAEGILAICYHCGERHSEITSIYKPGGEPGERIIVCLDQDACQARLHPTSDNGICGFCGQHGPVKGNNSSRRQGNPIEENPTWFWSCQDNDCMSRIMESRTPLRLFKVGAPEEGWIP